MSESSKKKIFLICLTMAGIPALISITFAWLYYFLPSPEDKLIFGALATMIGNIPWGFVAPGAISDFLAKFAEPPISGMQISCSAAILMSGLYLTNWGLNLLLVFLALTVSPKKRQNKNAVD